MKVFIAADGRKIHMDKFTEKSIHAWINPKRFTSATECVRTLTINYGPIEVARRAALCNYWASNRSISYPLFDNDGKEIGIVFSVEVCKTEDDYQNGVSGLYHEVAEFEKGDFLNYAVSH